MKRQTLIRDLLANHFAPLALERLVVLRSRFPLWMRPDVLRGVEQALAHAGELQLLGARLRGSGLEFRFSDLVEGGRNAIAVGPPAYDDVEIGEPEPMRCPQRGLWLVRRGDLPLAVLLEVDEGFRFARVRLEVAAPEALAASNILERIRETAGRADSFRGKVLAPAREECEFGESLTTLRVTGIAPVAREEIVLAPGVLEIFEQNTIGFAMRCDALVSFGMSGQKGVLLYGPPGTGKTMLVRYLAGAMTGHTKFLLSGDRIGWLSETIEAARRLSPAMVVIEDVDLIGADRDGPWQQAPAALNRMLNDMDGAGPDARVLFVLTTNRPEVLEPALAARPGRVDQAIEIGLPEDRERRMLLRRYACGLPLNAAAVAHASRRIGKVSPAFIKELTRRAAQAMLDRGGSGLEASDFDRSLRDMVGPGGRVSARLLGAERVGFLA